MSWADRYREQASAWAQMAHQWSTHGKEDKAQQCLAYARVYEELSEEALDKTARLSETSKSERRN